MIMFRTLKYRNLLSTGNAWTEIQLDKTSSTLIIGENGAGKSTMLDAICFALYGKPFRKINKPQLVNSIQGKGLEVEVTFDVGRKSYVIKRGIRPGIFEIWCDGKMLNQDASARDYQAHLEENVLKMNFKSFGQIVVLGSSTFVPFMQLPSAARRAVIEDLLDLQIFTTMNSLLKERTDDNKDGLASAKHSTEMLTNKIDMAKKHTSMIQMMKMDNVDGIKADMRSAIAKAEDAQTTIGRLREDIKDVGYDADLHDKLKLDISKTQTVSQALLLDKSDVDRKLKFYVEHQSCPTCSQKIADAFKAGEVDRLNTELKHLYTEYERVNHDLEYKTDVHKAFVAQATEVHEFESEIGTQRHIIQMQKDALRSLKTKLDNAKVEVDEVDSREVEQFERELQETEVKHKGLATERELLAVAATMLRDAGIKAKIIKQYVPVINKLINKYLADMDFFVQFELDESFNETIKSRHRDIFSYASFSEGEKLRIDLCLMLTWRAVSRLRSTVTTNLLVLDEVFDGSLDNDGIEALTSILTSSTENSNIFIISHKGDKIQDKFDRQLVARKVKNFSVLKEEEIDL